MSSDHPGWQEATIVQVPSMDFNEGSRGAEEDPYEETWPITKRDLPLSNPSAIRVMDYAHVVLSKRLPDNNNDGLDILSFETSLARFLNSEIELGKRVAFGNFAEIFIIRKWKEPKAPKPCTPEQAEAANVVMETFRPEELVVKVLRAMLLSNVSLYATGAADILAEGTLLATLNHPHIVKIHGRSVPSVEGFASGKRDSFFLILERLYGNLADKVGEWYERASDNRMTKVGVQGMRRTRAMIMLERVEALKQLADAITYLHSKQIMHRDLKLSNVGLDHHGRVKLLDFGLAKVLPPHTNENDTFKMTGNTGSMRYMAPEIARNETYNLKADVYSFGIILYEVLNMSKAWSGLQPHEIKNRAIVRKQRPLISMLWPAPLRDLLRSSWSDLPAARCACTRSSPSAA